MLSHAMRATHIGYLSPHGIHTNKDQIIDKCVTFDGITWTSTFRTSDVDWLFQRFHYGKFW